MAFEDNMIEAGYSDEQEYLDSLIDDFERNYKRQLEREAEYDVDFDSDYDEEEERERRKQRQKEEKEKQWVNNWKVNNPDLAIIWWADFRTRSYCAQLSDYNIKEYKELKKWLNEREHFENERKKEEWPDNIYKLFALYKDELFKFYFSDDEEQINMALVSQQAHELSSIEFFEPSLWESVCSNYNVDPTLFETIEDEAFWNEVYKREMDYEFWRDSHIEKYNLLAKHWIADSAIYIYGDWWKKHELEEIEWKKQNQELWNSFKQNYEIREKNKFIKSKIDEYENKNIFEEEDYDFEEDLSYLAGCDINSDESEKEFLLLDFECKAEMPFDVSTLNKELYQYIQDGICSLDIGKISIESSRYADKVLSQLWIYENRDEWEMDALKKHHEYLFRYEQKYSHELLDWWKEKYPTEWENYIKNIVPLFKKNFEVVMKFRFWVLDGNQKEFIALGDKYLSYWKKTLTLMYGQDIHEQLCHYFYDEIGHSTDFWGEDIDYIKKCASTNQDVEIWQKELQDKLIWDTIYNKNYQEHYDIEYMYTSLYMSDD